MFYGHVASIFDDPVEKLKTKGWISSTQKNTRNLFRWKTINQRFPMDTKTADSTTRPKNFYQKAKTFDRCPKNMEKKRNLLNIFFLIMCLWLHKMKFWPSCKSVFVKIRKNLAQLRNWLENQNFNFKSFPKKFKRHSKKHFFQFSRKIFAKR